MISRHKLENNLEKVSLGLTKWVGTPLSLVVHTILFAGIFVLVMLGFPLDKTLLILTTAVSLEAIYLSIFIQMTVNRSVESLEEVNEDIEQIQKNVKDIDEDVDEISEDLEKIQESDVEDDLQERKKQDTLEKIEGDIQKLLKDIEQLKK